MFPASRSENCFRSRKATIIFETAQRPMYSTSRSDPCIQHRAAMVVFKVAKRRRHLARGFNPGSDDAPIPFPKPRQGRRVIRTSIIKTVTTSIPLRKIHRPAGACWVWITPFPGVKTPVCIPASHPRLKTKALFPQSQSDNHFRDRAATHVFNIAQRPMYSTSRSDGCV